MENLKEELKKHLRFETDRNFHYDYATIDLCLYWDDELITKETILTE